MYLESLWYRNIVLHYRNPPGKWSDIMVFFEMVSKFYEKCNRPSDLFLDLIQLNDLLTSSTDSSLVETDETAFYQFLHEKIKPNISNAILKDLSTFIVSFHCLCDGYNNIMVLFSFLEITYSRYNKLISVACLQSYFRG